MKNTFTEADKQKAMAIVRVFETGKPRGNYAAVAVLNDGAGVSFGASQFTHRSGSLRAVIDEYLRLEGVVGRRVFVERYRLLNTISPEAIGRLSTDTAFKNALRAAAVTREMRAAQDTVAVRKYLQPAIDACEGSGFVLPLSLAVIYDSMTHGSYEKIRDRVKITPSDSFEKTWITEYVRGRDAWLGSIPRLRVTRYRTRFFLDQIKLGRWDLELPLNVHGVRLSEVQSTRFSLPPTSSTNDPAIPATTLLKQPAIHSDDRQAEACTLNPESRNAGSLDNIEQHVNSAAETYDQIERIATTVITRTDRAKSLWTTVTGTLFQTAWAVFSFAAGIPRELWFFAAGVAAALTLMYLYRQITLGKMRESQNI